jgi:hypothetical protein
MDAVKTFYDKQGRLESLVTRSCAVQSERRLRPIRLVRDQLTQTENNREDTSPPPHACLATRNFPVQFGKYPENPCYSLIFSLLGQSREFPPQVIDLTASVSGFFPADGSVLFGIPVIFPAKQGGGGHGVRLASQTNRSSEDRSRPIFAKRTQFLCSNETGACSYP